LVEFLQRPVVLTEFGQGDGTLQCRLVLVLVMGKGEEVLDQVLHLGRHLRRLLGPLNLVIADGQGLDFAGDRLDKLLFALGLINFTDQVEGEVVFPLGLHQQPLRPVNFRFPQQ
jgi:hypothetical protein